MPARTPGIALALAALGIIVEPLTPSPLSFGALLWGAARSDGSVPVPAADGDSPPVRVTVYMVWASRKDPEEKPPKELKPFTDQLRKVYRGGSFRLHEKPVSKAVDADTGLSLRLPQGYETRWTLVEEPSGKPALRQVLVNPRKVQSVDLLKKSPAITHLERIRRGDETFLLIVVFQKGNGAEKPRAE